MSSTELKLLVEWSSPWEEFRSAWAPAVMRSPKRLAGEAPVGIFPYRGMLASMTAEILLFVIVIFLSRGFDSMRTNQLPVPAKYDVIYFSGKELPQTRDSGGAQSGRAGRSGGREAHNATQVIRVARGEALREKVVDAPKLNLPHSDSAVANLLAFRPLPGPPPMEGLRSSLRSPLLAPAAIAPSPEIQRERLRADAMLTATAVAPAPSAGEVTNLRLPGSQAVQVVPPPVSAPERPTSNNARLTLPAPAVIVPPPQLSQQIAKNGPGFGPGDLQKQVVPPPVQLGSATGERRTVSGLGTSTSAVPPTVQIGSTKGTSRTVASLGGATAVAPTVQLSSGSASRGPASTLAGGSAIVPPPPSVADGGSLNGHGRGNRGSGLGGPGDIGDAAAPPANGGNGKGAGVVVSNQPGTKVGVPGGGGIGTLAMSPDGGDQPGFGGYGGGNGVTRGNGPGSGLTGEGPGGGRTGSGHGSDPTARGGISPYPGHGGAGSSSGASAVPGVEVSGGTSVINLPSFSDGQSDPNDPTRSSVGADKRQGITVVATSRSAGAFNFYGALKGDKVYTIYIDTSLGTAVMQFADPSSAARPGMQELTSPQPIHTSLPPGLQRNRLVIACILDRTGILRDPQVIESAAQALASKVLAALPSWKFSPALRGNQPVEVNALLGFGIDTSDRY